MSSYYERKNNGDGTYSALQHLTGSDMILPVDIQSKLAQTIQTHNAVSVATVSTSAGNWIDTDGFDKAAFTMLCDANTSNNLTIYWSNDGTNIHGSETPIATGSGQWRAGIADIKARYLKVNVYNGDTASHTMSAWALLKA